MIKVERLAVTPFYGRLQLNAKAAAYALLLLPFFSIDVLWTLLGPMYRAWQIASLAVLSVGLVKMGTVRLGKFHLWYLAYTGLVLLSAIKHGTFVPGMAFTLAANLILVLYAGKMPETFLSAVNTVIIVLLPLNLLSMAYFDEIGYYDTMVFRNRYAGIIGGKNGFITCLVPLAILYVYSLYKRGKSLQWGHLAFALSMFMCFLAKSATGILVGAFITVVYIFRGRMRFHYQFWLAASLAVYVVLIAGNQALLNGRLGELVFGLVGHKDTFAIRLMIWDQLLSMMQNSWLLGIGRGTPVPVGMYGTVVNSFTDAHNSLLGILRNCGLLGFFAYAMSMFHAVKRRRRYHSGEAVLFIGVICVIAAGLMEDRMDFPYLWILLAFMDNEREQELTL